MIQQIETLLQHYGYVGMMVALMGGIVGIPLPDEVLLTYVGYTVFQGEMSYVVSLLSAGVGAIGGISLSYFLGWRFGLPLVERYGARVHLTEQKVARTTKLFQRFGPFVLVFGYFIPGVRHVTAYVAALNRFSFRRFALYAYTGALIWNFTFITLGRKLGENWILVETYMVTYRIYLGLLTVLSIGIGYLIWRNTGDKR